MRGYFGSSSGGALRLTWGGWARKGVLVFPRTRLKTTFTYLSDEGLANGHCGGATRFTHLA